LIFEFYSGLSESGYRAAEVARAAFPSKRNIR
jgi:hypothetical protein